MMILLALLALLSLIALGEFLVAKREEAIKDEATVAFDERVRRQRRARGRGSTASDAGWPLPGDPVYHSLYGIVSEVGESPPADEPASESHDHHHHDAADHHYDGGGHFDGGSSYESGGDFSSDSASSD